MTPTPTCLTDRLATMDFARRLATIRREQNLTQQVLADRVGIHVSQLRRYEAGTNQPTLDVLRNLALALSISSDDLVFDDTERGPQTPTLRLRMEALDHLDPDEQGAVLAMIEGAPATPGTTDRHHPTRRQLNTTTRRPHRTSRTCRLRHTAMHQQARRAAAGAPDRPSRPRRVAPVVRGTGPAAQRPVR